MKKTLIALAALAATGTAFAQSSVTISGKFGVSGVKNEINAAADAKAEGKKSAANFGVTDGDVRFSGVEDIGGGLKADFSMEIRVRGRGDAGSVYRNATIGLAHTAFGKVTTGSIEVGNGIKTRGWAGAPIGIANALEANGTSGPLGAYANSDILQYTSPELVKGLTVSALRAENIGTAGQSVDKVNGLATRGSAANTLGVSFTDGPISAGADYTIFNKNAATNAAKEATRIRVSGSYNLGVAVVGAGYEKNSDMADNTTGTAALPLVTAAARNKANYTAGVKVPLGAFTLGAVYAKSEATKSQATAFAAAAYGLAAQYDFSKRTNVNYTFLKQSESNDKDFEGNRHQLRLMHSF